MFYGTGLHRSRLGAMLRRVVQFSRRAGRAGGAGSWSPPGIEKPDTSGVLVAFKIGGGIGDHLIAARYIRDLIAAVGEFRFDIYSSRPATANWIFSGMSQFNRCYDDYFSWSLAKFYKHYPIAMWISQFVVLYEESTQWVTLHKLAPKLVRICESISRFRIARGLEEIIHAHPRLDNLLGTTAVFANLNRHNFAQAMSEIRYGGHSLSLPLDSSLRSKFALHERRYVTIHNGFDSEFQTGNGFADRSTKVYHHFEAVLSRLRTSYPDLFVVQIGSTTSRPIDGVDLQLINKTTLAEATAILAGSMLHIDGESGLVHLAACIGTVSCVVFGPTPAAYFGYDENINITPHVCGGCWWSTKEWMTNCPRGFEEPICLAQTSPEKVANAILAHLDRQELDMDPPVSPRSMTPRALPSGAQVVSS
jgi:hypothetical protein